MFRPHVVATAGCGPDSRAVPDRRDRTHKPRNLFGHGTSMRAASVGVVRGCLSGVTSETPEEEFMSKSPINNRKAWSSADDKALRDLARGNTPTRVMGLKLGRTEDAVRSRAADQGVSLKPTNQSPYGRGGK